MSDPNQPQQGQPLEGSPLESAPLESTQLPPSEPLGGAAGQPPVPPQMREPAQAPQAPVPPQEGGQPPYGGGMPPQAPQPPQGPPPAAPQKTNTLAIVAFIAAFLVSIVGIILGHIALSQIKKTGEGGRGLALAGTIIGYVLTFIGLIVGVIVLITTLIFGSIVSAGVDEYNQALDEFTEQVEENDFADFDETDDFDFDSNMGPSPSDPWAGTVNEEYCNLLMYDLSHVDVTDAAEMLERLADASADPDHADVLREMSDLVERDVPDSDVPEDLFERYMLVMQESAELCYDF